MGVKAQCIDRKFQIFRLGEIQHGRITIVEPVAPAIKFFQTGRRDKVALALRARQQNTAFFKALANGGNAQRQFLIVKCISRAAMGAQARLKICLIDFAAGENQRAGSKINLVMAHHHKNFRAAIRVAQHHHRGGRN